MPQARGAMEAACAVRKMATTTIRVFIIKNEGPGPSRAMREVRNIMGKKEGRGRVGQVGER